MFHHSPPRAAEKHPRQHDPVYGITTAEESLSADIARRQKQYLLTMGFRVVAIVVVVWVPWLNWPTKIALGVVATIIPFIAVVRANGAPAPEHDPTNLLLSPPGPRQIEGRDTSLPAAEEVYRADPWDGGPDGTAGSDARPDASSHGDDL